MSGAAGLRGEAQEVQAPAGGGAETGEVLRSRLTARIQGWWRRLEAKYRLKNYCLKMRSSWHEPKTRTKFEHGDWENIAKAVQEAPHRIERHQRAEKCEREAKLK